MMYFQHFHIFFCFKVSVGHFWILLLTFNQQTPSQTSFDSHAVFVIIVACYIYEIKLSLSITYLLTLFHEALVRFLMILMAQHVKLNKL